MILIIKIASIYNNKQLEQEYKKEYLFVDGELKEILFAKTNTCSCDNKLNSTDYYYSDADLVTVNQCPNCSSFIIVNSHFKSFNITEDNLEFKINYWLNL